MRLLRCKPNDKSGDIDLVFTKDLITDIPPYAVLSHTWGEDDEEVTYQDVKDNLKDERVQNKPGYQKILFCGTKAQKDGLNHFWVDTCCIDKTNNTELHEAINSMFTWYEKSAACYVYLSDVLRNDQMQTGESTRSTWELAFRQSRWHTRGWTLQELVASSSVEFFSSDYQRLGDKQSLERLINEASHVPLRILRGNLPSEFSIEERISWSDHRTTKRPEDKAYSLLGIVGVYMPLIYGEGEARALERLRREYQFARLEADDHTSRCLADLRISDPRDDKSRIESAKGGLLKDCYQWVLDHEGYLKWLHDDERPLLWVKGDPGKGKTMLLCGIINELGRISENQPSISYFFCQAADVKLNHAAAVLRGLIYMLVRQNPALMKYLLEEWKVAGAGLFQDLNSWVALTRIMNSMLQHIHSSEIVVLIVDALDECVRDLPKLISFIVQQSASGKAKWLVSSRNWPEIAEQLDPAMSKIRLSLEINAHAISAAVTAYIHQRVHEIGSIKCMNEAQKREMAQYLNANADHTFLWVALVCQRLRDPKVRKRHVMSELMQFPPGLDEMYKRMMQLVDGSRDANICREILATVAATYRPLNVHELGLLLTANVFDEDVTELADIIRCCGSFLLIRQNVVYFVHLSAKDFLVKLKETPLFANGIHSKHTSLCIASLKAFSRQLRQDIYGLQKPGIAATELCRPSPDPLDPLLYSCIFWIDHFLAGNSDGAQGRNEVATELLRTFFTKDYLHWLEALSLWGAVPVGHAAVANLYRSIKV
jgi:nucleoside-triphosphatase THEP1